MIPYQRSIVEALRRGLGADAADRYLRLSGPQDGSDDRSEETAQNFLRVPTPVVDRRGLPPGHRPHYTWCLDAGHGPKTVGEKYSPKLAAPVNLWAEGPGDGPDRYRLYEWAYNRDIVERILEILSALGLSYMRTMEPNQARGNDLAGRVKAANAWYSEAPKRYVSVHGNASRTPGNSLDLWGAGRGIEVFHAPGSREGEPMAHTFQNHIVAGLREYVESTGLQVNAYGPGGSRLHGSLMQPAYIHYRRVAPATFYVLRETDMPAILTESLFFNHPLDVQLMLLPGVRQAIAEAHVDAIIECELLAATKG